MAKLATERVIGVQHWIMANVGFYRTGKPEAGCMERNSTVDKHIRTRTQQSKRRV